MLGERRTLLTTVAIAILAVITAVAAGVGVVRVRDAGGPTAAVRPVDAEVMTVKSRPLLLIVGDSYAEGVSPQIPTYAPGLAESMGWDLALDAQGGTGFLSYRPQPGTVTAPFIDRLDRDVKTYDPQHILIDGGRNDLDKPIEAVLAAMSSYVTDVRRAWPEATITLVVPSYITSTPAPDYPALRAGVDTIAAQVGAGVIDPVAEGWYRTVDPGWLWTDGVHPSAAGGEYIRQRLADDLRAMGLGGKANT